MKLTEIFGVWFVLQFSTVESLSSDLVLKKKTHVWNFVSITDQQ